MLSFKDFLAEGEVASSDFKIGKSGRRIRAHHFKVGDVARERGPNHPIEFGTGLTTADYTINKFGKKERAKLNPTMLKVKDGMVVWNKDSKMQESLPVEKEDPPAVLVLRRRAIRLYPDRTKIALYYNQKLNKYFSVPYSEGPMNSVIQAEEIENE